MDHICAPRLNVALLLKMDERPRARTARVGRRAQKDVADAGEAAGEGAGIAHQVHGAIGFTMEHILQRYSRRVWSWRDEFGSESAWAVRLGEAVAANGGDELWASLAAR